ncbi:hypothetical protein MMP65_19385 [Acinetobacter sp. ANC 3926]|uniref:hypothetical protein n=1 Tax=Acinetobacter genomosp. 15BJ TaxID=106651 RepID=UPI001F4B2F41|nr:hypothetical protein [Acinetobacter genomosp. 15BJ]MCH7293598.1 hypothetical protein [Acinetobacter genomosp. 15BJ]
MSFDFQNLSKEVREKMQEEIKSDISKNNLYFSKRFNQKGRDEYSDILLKHVETGNEISLGNDLKQKGCFNSVEETKTGVKNVPYNAHETFAEGEFNRFYVRGLCLIAISKQTKLQVYRAKNVENSRSASEQKIGSFIDPQKLLKDLRENIGIDTALELPPGPNSGLSVKLA